MFRTYDVNSRRHSARPERKILNPARVENLCSTLAFLFGVKACCLPGNSFVLFGSARLSVGGAKFVSLVSTGPTTRKYFKTNSCRFSVFLKMPAGGTFAVVSCNLLRSGRSHFNTSFHTTKPAEITSRPYRVSGDATASPKALFSPES